MHAVLQQKNKTFEPHLLVVTKGSTVDFPNRDPWFHNVFSLFNGKRFDLGLYEAGTSRTVHFDREGISYIFCNIHPEMSAVVVVLASQYFAYPTSRANSRLPRCRRDVTPCMYGTKTLCRPRCRRYPAPWMSARRLIPWARCVYR